MDPLNLITRVEAMFIFDPNQDEILVQQINSPELNSTVLTDIMKEFSSENCSIFSYKNFIIIVNSLMSNNNEAQGIISDIYFVIIGNENANEILLSDFSSNISSCIIQYFHIVDIDKLMKHIDDLYLIFDDAVVNGFIVESDPAILFKARFMMYNDIKEGEHAGESTGLN